MAKTPHEIFIEIKDTSQKTKILEDLARRSMPIKIKGLAPSSDVFDASPRSLDSWKLLCRITEKSQDWKKDHALIVQFDHYDEKYVSQVSFELHENTISLDFNSALFRVQRREDYRLKIPRSMESSIKLLIEEASFEFNILDLSSGGCRIEVDIKNPLQKNLKYSAILKPKDRSDIHARVEIRHIEKINEKVMSVGLQFIELTEIQKNRIAALVMDLYRTFFKSRIDK